MLFVDASAPFSYRCMSMKVPSQGSEEGVGKELWDSIYLDYVTDSGLNEEEKRILSHIWILKQDIKVLCIQMS